LDLLTLMREHDMDHRDFARALGISTTRFKELLWDKDMRLSDLNKLLDVFSHELVPIFRRRWPVTHN
jgi:hypothetical protein